ncbi:MAG TPA: hypothetical protein VGJ22_05360 [Anaerolineales bacterium]
MIISCTAVAIQSCGQPQRLPATDAPESATADLSASSSATLAPGTSTLIPLTATNEIEHLMRPAASQRGGKLVYDVESILTAPERRAPYGDSYDINRLERPFLQDMTYVPDLDIATYTVTKDDDFWYVSLELIGTDPNNGLGIHYGVELDLNADGFGDYLIWGNPPYTPAWDTAPVQIFQDTNHDTGGLSAERSDAPLPADGYDTLIFNGGDADADPDLAWVRINAGRQSTVQFAFKRSWSGSIFMIGVLADAGLQDAQSFDYVDRFEESEAGSPVKDKSSYPLKALYAVDNACREAFGFQSTGLEPQLCPFYDPSPQPRKTPYACKQPAYCIEPTYTWYPQYCYCAQN